MIQVSINSRRVREALQALAERAMDSTPVMRDVSGVLLDAAQRAFLDQADPTTGAKWPALATSTVQARGSDGPILRLSGQLMTSLQTEHGADYAVVGTNKVYAAIHQFGGTIRPHDIRPRHGKALAFNGVVVGRVRHPGATIPARPFLGLGESDAEEVVDLVQTYLRAALD